MEVFVGHQHQTQIALPWPLQAVTLPLMISMEIVGLQNRTMNSWTSQALHHLRFPRLHQEHLNQRW